MSESHHSQKWPGWTDLCSSTSKDPYALWAAFSSKRSREKDLEQGECQAGPGTSDPEEIKTAPVVWKEGGGCSVGKLSVHFKRPDDLPGLG